MDKGLLRGGESTSHASGNDIEYTVVETGQNVLIEGDEYHLCKAAMLSDEIHEYVAKTNKEILDDIYTRSSCMVKEGEAHAGDFIICKVAVRDDTKRNRTGKIREIISVIQGENGCKVVDESQYEDEFARGGEISSTIAPKKERIYGSKNNPKGSSESGESAKSIKFSQSTLDAITNKVEEHNKNHPEKKVTLEIAKAVVRRGMGAYSSTHRPTIKGGKPNSRVAWGLARLNAFLYKAVKGESKSGKYSQDNDLLDELGIKHSQFAEGGTIDKRYVAEADFYVNAKNDDQAKKEANEVAKLIDDKYDNKATVNHLYEIYGGIGNSRKVFKDGGSFQPSYPINNAGGYDYKGKAKETAEKVYLLSLPRNVDGTHCGNCFFQQQGICVHKEIMLPVTDRMCCSVWDNSNSERSYSKNLQKDKGSVPEKVKTYPKNDKGGYTYSGEALKTAKKFDLITLPKDIEGTNCANCSWYTPYKEGGFCFRSNIWLPVNARMSCAFWNNLSVKRDWGLLRFDTGGEINSDTYNKWKSLVNMSKGELEKFYNSEEGKKAGLSKGAAQELGISYGRESARWIMKMKDTPVSEWTPEMWKWAKKQIGFISRMSFNKGALYDNKGRKTRKHTSLLIWGHNPEKYSEGGEVNLLAPNGKPSNLTAEQYKLVRTPEFKAWFGDWEKLANIKINDSGIDRVSWENLSKDVSKEGGILKGLSDGMTLHDIAAKHKKPYKELMAEFKKGIKIESEHTKNTKMAMEIAKDHLFENPKYYTLLEKYVELGSGGTIGENFYIAARELFQRYLVSNGLFLLPNDKFFIRGDMFSVHFIVERADNGEVYKAEYVVFSSPVYDQSTVQEFLKAIQAESHYLDVDAWDESDESNWMRLLRSNVNSVENIEDYDFQEKMVAIGDFNINEFDFDFLPMSEFLESIGYMAYKDGGSFSDFSPQEIQVLIEPYKDDVKTLRYLANRMSWNDFVSAVGRGDFHSELQRFGRAVPIMDDSPKAVGYENINESETEILNFYALSFSNNPALRIGDILFADMDSAKVYVRENGITSWDYKLVSVSSDDLISYQSGMYVYSPKIFRDYVGSLKQFWENSK